MGAQRRVRPVNRVEVVATEPDQLAVKINEALQRQASLKLVGTAMNQGEEGKITVLLAFTST